MASKTEKTAERFKKIVKAAGCDVTHTQRAETSTLYLTVDSAIVVRFADHAQVYAGAHFSVDPETGHTAESAAQKVIEALQDDEVYGEVQRRVDAQAQEQRENWEEYVAQEIRKRGGKERVAQRIAEIEERLSLRANEGGLSGDGRRSLRGLQKHLKSLVE